VFIEMIWIFDKINLPPMYPRKNRYAMIEDISEDVTVFHSGRNDFFREQKSVPRIVKIDSKVYLRSFICGRGVVSYLTFAFSSLLRGVFYRARPRIIVGSCPDPFQSITAFLVSKVKRSAFAVDFRDYWPELLIETRRIGSHSLKAKVLFRLTRYLARKADFVMAPTNRVFEYLESRGINSKEVFILENLPVVMLDRLEESSVSKFIEQQKLSGKKVLLLAGRANFASLPETVIEAIKQYNESEKSLQLVVLGDSSIFHSLRAILSSAGISVALDPALSRNKYLKCLELSDALMVISDSLGDFSSNKVNDALALGTPVIFITPDTEIDSKEIPGIRVTGYADPKVVFENLKDCLEDYNKLRRAEIKKHIQKRISSQKQSISEFLKRFRRRG